MCALCSGRRIRKPCSVLKSCHENLKHTRQRFVLAQDTDLKHARLLPLPKQVIALPATENVTARNWISLRLDSSDVKSQSSALRRWTGLKKCLSLCIMLFEGRWLLREIWRMYSLRMWNVKSFWKLLAEKAFSNKAFLGSTRWIKFKTKVSEVLQKNPNNLFQGLLRQFLVERNKVYAHNINTTLCIRVIIFTRSNFQTKHDFSDW